MFFGIVFLIIGIGGVLQALGLISKSVDLFWPLIFLALGLSLLFGDKGKCFWGWWEQNENKDAQGTRN